MWNLQVLCLEFLPKWICSIKYHQYSTKNRTWNLQSFTSMVKIKRYTSMMSNDRYIIENFISNPEQIRTACKITLKFLLSKRKKISAKIQNSMLQVLQIHSNHYVHFYVSHGHKQHHQAQKNISNKVCVCVCMYPHNNATIHIKQNIFHLRKWHLKMYLTLGSNLHYVIIMQLLPDYFSNKLVRAV